VTLDLFAQPDDGVPLAVLVGDRGGQLMRGLPIVAQPHRQPKRFDHPVAFVQRQWNVGLL